MTSALVTVADPAALAWGAAERVVELMENGVAERGRFTVALSGGFTPWALHERLADPTLPFRGRVRWPAVHVFFGDERAVPPDHVDSNYRSARKALLDSVAPGSVHRMQGELGGAEAAARYEAELRGFFGGVPFPELDLVLLGLGKDGHTASLFPDSPALHERERWVVAASGPPPDTDRITLTVPVLARARDVMFLVAGPGKADPLRRLVRPGAGEDAIPAARIPFQGRVRVLADAAALRAVDGAGP